MGFAVNGPIAARRGVEGPGARGTSLLTAVDGSLGVHQLKAGDRQKGFVTGP